MIICWALVILGVVYLVQTATKGGKSAVQRETPFDILMKRYASGEISKEEFERMKEKITKS